MSPRAKLILLVVVVVVLLSGGGAAVVSAVRKLGKKEATNLSKLEPGARAALEALRRELAAAGLETFIGSTLRDNAEQAEILERGSSSTSRSWHLLGRAVDLYPIDPATKEPDLAGRNTELFRKMHEVAKRHGWRGLAFNADGSKRYITTSKGKVWDGGHLEFPSGMTWAEAADLYRKSGGVA